MATLVYEDFPGNTTTYPINFEYLNPTCIYVGYITEEEDLTPITEGWSLTDATTITFDAAPGGTIRIYRVTPVDEPVATFYPTVAIRAIDLNNNFDQCLMRLQEINGDLVIFDGELDSIKDDIDAINEIVTELSGIEIIADVTAFNAFTPAAGSEGSAIQITDSSNWQNALNVTGTPPGFTGSPEVRVNVRITQVSPKQYAFMNYVAADPDARYVLKSGDTMTGLLTLSGAPQADLQAATKKYVDDKTASDINTTYDFGAATDGSNAQLQLVGSDGSTDAVTITPGSNITITSQSSSGFTINAAGSAIPGTGNVTITAGNGMTGGGSFNVNQSSDTNITLNATGSGSTNLGWSATATNGTVSSDTGTNATLTVATTSAAGLMSAADKTTFDAIPSVYLTQTAAATAYIKADISSYPLLP